MKEKDLTEQQAKAIAILDEAMKQSGKAIGDYSRTKDSLANTERRLDEQFKALKETLGKQLIPLFVEGAKVATDMLNAIENIFDLADKNKPKRTPLDKGFIETTTGAIKDLTVGFFAIPEKFVNMFDMTLGRSGGILQPLIKQTDALTDHFNTSLDFLSEGVFKVGEGTVKVIKDIIPPFDEASASIREMRDRLKEVKEEIEKQGDTSTTLAGLKKERDSLDAHIKTLLGEQTSELKNQNTELEKLNKKRADFIFKSRGNITSMLGQGDKSNRPLTDTEKGFAGKGVYSGLGDQMKIVAQPIKEATEGFDELKNNSQSFTQTFQSNFSQAWTDIFGEANSLFEQFMENLTSSLLSFATQNIAGSLFEGLMSFLPGGSIISGIGSLFGFGASGGGESKIGNLTPQRVSLVFNDRIVGETLVKPYLKKGIKETIRINRGVL